MAASNIRQWLVAGEEAKLLTDLSVDVHSLEVAPVTVSGVNTSIRLPLVAGAEASISTNVLAGVHTLNATP